MATVRKRSWQTGGETRSSWVADYTDQGGKRHLKTFRTRKAADAWLVAARGEVQRGTHTADSGSITIAEAAAIWLAHGELEGLERSTMHERRRMVELHLCPRIGAIKLARLSTPLVENFRDRLLGQISRITARHVLAALKSILSEAQRRGLVAYNAASPVRIDMKRREMPKLAVGQDIPSKAEIRALLDLATGRLRAMLVTAIFTGLRASELRGLTWDAVDLDRKVLQVRQRADRWGTLGAPKSASGRREVPLSPMVVNTLREWRMACPKGILGLVFPNGIGRVERHTNILIRGWYPLLITAGVTDARGKPKYGFHALRHFCASWLIEQDFSSKRVQVWLGHSSIKMTFDVYGHLFPSLEDDHAKIAAGELTVIG